MPVGFRSLLAFWAGGAGSPPVRLAATESATTADRSTAQAQSGVAETGRSAETLGMLGTAQRPETGVSTATPTLSATGQVTQAGAATDTAGVTGQLTSPDNLRASETSQLAVTLTPLTETVRGSETPLLRASTQAREVGQGIELPTAVRLTRSETGESSTGFRVELTVRAGETAGGSAVPRLTGQTQTGEAGVGAAALPVVRLRVSEQALGLEAALELQVTTPPTPDPVGLAPPHGRAPQHGRFSCPAPRSPFAKGRQDPWSGAGPGSPFSRLRKRAR